MFTVPQSPCLYGTAPVSSCAHYSGSWLDWSDWSTLTRFYSPEQAYGNSEVAQVLSSPHLTRMMEAQGQGVKVYSCTASTLVLSTQNSMSMSDPDLATWGSGLHLENHRPVGVSSFAGRRENQEKMWADTCRLLGIQNFGQP